MRDDTVPREGAEIRDEEALQTRRIRFACCPPTSYAIFMARQPPSSCRHCLYEPTCYAIGWLTRHSVVITERQFRLFWLCRREHYATPASVITLSRDGVIRVSDAMTARHMRPSPPTIHEGQILRNFFAFGLQPLRDASYATSARRCHTMARCRQQQRTHLTSAVLLAMNAELLALARYGRAPYW